MPKMAVRIISDKEVAPIEILRGLDHERLIQRLQPTK
jgi:hypothetical protein